MAGRTGPQPRSTGGDGSRVGWASALFWRVFLLNALVFALGVALLVVSPATVSAPASVRELAVLAIGLAVMLGVNAALLRASLRPLEGLAALMQRVDLLRPGERVSVTGNGDVAHLVNSFNEMLDRLESERGASTARTLAAMEGERQRIAQELHDEIGQGLTAVLLSLKRTVDHAPPEMAVELSSVQDITRACLDEVRQVARRLRPGVLDDLGLVSALQALVLDFSRATELSITPSISSRLPAMDPVVELVVYRIAQEALTNAARHAGAVAVELSLVVGDGRVVLLVSDSGHGIGGAAEGAGIRGMRERALLIGADLVVEPGPLGGTRVQLTIPRPTTRTGTT
ncbi:histidine kinase [Pseudonocardia sp.]|uniref:sensor histidine kinase n=1 Tax=Pseudonocardia sp. TaxID=60912 RepID=UPI003D109122